MAETLILAKKRKKKLILKWTMHGHFGQVTAIATPINSSDTFVSCSEDKSLLLWTRTKESANSAETAGSTPYGKPLRLRGHFDCVYDVVLSSDGQSALSSSRDGELRLWDLSTGATTRVFFGHTHHVLSVAFFDDDRQIVSASRDHTIKFWNRKGECEHTIQDDDGHRDWVSCVRFSPNRLQPTLVSGSWDRTVKVWNPINRKLKSTLAGHRGYVCTVAVSPDGSICASGSGDGTIVLWDLATGERMRILDASYAPIYSLCFSPNGYWICAAIDQSVVIWDLERKTIVQDLKPDAPTSEEDEIFHCTSLCWSCDGSTLFTGYADGIIRVWGISCWD